jgi:hypothetical protein
MRRADRTGADRAGAGGRSRRKGDSTGAAGDSRRSEPEWRWSDSLAMVIAGLQVVLPFVAIIIAATTVAYLLVALLFR